MVDADGAESRCGGCKEGRVACNYGPIRWDKR